MKGLVQVDVQVIDNSVVNRHPSVHVSCMGRVIYRFDMQGHRGADGETYVTGDIHFSKPNEDKKTSRSVCFMEYDGPDGGPEFIDQVRETIHELWSDGWWFGKEVVR